MDRLAAYTTPRDDVVAMVPNQARTILDLGCSDGSLGAALRQRRDCRVVGIEADRELGGRAAERLDRTIIADLNAPDCLAPLAEMRFDCIIAADVLEHLVAPQEILGRVRRLLAPGGSVVISLPNIRHHSAGWSIYARGSFPRRERGLFDRTHLHWYTLRDARQLLGDAGYEVEAENYTLRVGDLGGGRINRITRRLLGPIASFAPIREFMTYQFVMRARAARSVPEK